MSGLRADDPGLPKEEELAGMSIAQLKAHLNKYSISSRDCVERRCDASVGRTPPREVRVLWPLGPSLSSPALARS